MVAILCPQGRKGVILPMATPSYRRRQYKTENPYLFPLWATRPTMPTRRTIPTFFRRSY